MPVERQNGPVAGMRDTDFFDIEKTSIFGRGFCNINNNFNSSSKHFAISISISILPQCISRYQYQYSLKGFCNTNINTDIPHNCFAIPISIPILSKGILQFQFRFNFNIIAIIQYQSQYFVQLWHYRSSLVLN